MVRPIKPNSRITQGRKGVKNIKRGVTDGQKKRHRYKPGTVALRDIRRAQKSVELRIRKLPFNRLLRGITQTFKHDARFQRAAVLLFQESVEAYAVRLLERANKLAIYGKRITVFARDMDEAVSLQGLRATRNAK